MKFSIPTLDSTRRAEFQAWIDNKTKPLGSLGKIEELALKLALIQDTTNPIILSPMILVFAGDHGLSDEGTSAFPKAVTAQMVHNFLQGGAAINAFSKEYGADFMVVDAGVDADFEEAEGLIKAKIAKGTQNCLHTTAMSPEQVQQCLEIGFNIVADCVEEGDDWFGFGEMGIGNTAIASLIHHYITGELLENCVGPGTGLTPEGISQKQHILEQVVARHGQLTDPMEILEKVGGFEIAQMVGAMISCGQHQVAFCVDGYIATAAYLLAHKMAPQLSDYAFFAHSSEEPGHRLMLDYLGEDPILKLGLRLGEGTGTALALPILNGAAAMMEMASFEAAGVSEKEEGHAS